MKESVLRLAPGLNVPADQFVQSATALIGKRGSGKSGGVKVIEEELFRVGLPFITLDPVGVHWGIRSSFDGKSAGLPVLVIGGEHGDVALDRRAGGATARAILESNVSCVIDFSEESKSVYREFVRDFAREIYAKNRTPRVIIIEEAPELVPQKYRPDMAETFEAVERLSRLGRNKNLGFVAVSQRAATINKDVLTQIDNLFVGRLVSPQDRAALKEWVEAWDVKAQLGTFTEALASLPTRTMYLWSPDTLKEFKQVRFRDFTTLHGDRTHLNRLGLLEGRPVTTDVSAVVAKLGEELSRLAKEKVDVAQVPRLKSELARLTAELDRTKNAPRAAMPAKPDPKALQEAYERGGREVAAKYKTSLAEYAKVQTKITGATSALVRAVDELPKLTIVHPPWQLEQHGDGRMSVRVLDVPEPARAPRSVTPAHVNESMPETGDGSEKKLYSGAIRILAEFARKHPLGLTYGQAATLTGFAPKGHTFKTYTGLLKRRGLIEHGPDGTMRVTAAGLSEVGEIPPAPRTHAEVMALWQRNLYAGAYKILERIVERYPGDVDVETIASETGFAAGGHTLKTYLGILQRNLLIVRKDGAYSASPSLYPD